MIYFVTGGSRGIGAEIVQSAVELGHDVAFTYMTNEAKAHEVVAKALETRPEAKCKCYKLDVRKPDDVDDVVAQVLEDFEDVHVVVNNAGVTRDNLMLSVENDEWDDVIATNLSGPFYVCRQFMPTLLSNRFGRIINISSVSAVGVSGQAAYSAAKAGLHGFTVAVAKEYGRKGITTNAVAPGYFETDMTKGELPRLNHFWKTYCPMPKGRTGKMHELTSVVHFLASEDAAFINGQIINVTGGLDWGP